MDFVLAGLCVKTALTDKSFTSCRNWLASGVAALTRANKTSRCQSIRKYKKLNHNYYTTLRADIVLLIRDYLIDNRHTKNNNKHFLASLCMGIQKWMRPSPISRVIRPKGMK